MQFLHTVIRYTHVILKQKKKNNSVLFHVFCLIFLLNSSSASCSRTAENDFAAENERTNCGKIDVSTFQRSAIVATRVSTQVEAKKPSAYAYTINNNNEHWVGGCNTKLRTLPAK